MIRRVDQYRLVSAEQIAAAGLPLQDVYDLVIEGFKLHASGEYECPPKQGVHTRPDAFMHAMPAYLPTKDLAGSKLVSVYPDNPAKGLAATTGLIMMMDPDTGVITDILDAQWVTNARTAMVSMVTAEHLAKSNPVFGLVGATGACGQAHIEAIATIFPGSRVLINSRSQERCEAVVSDYLNEPCELVVTMDQEALVKECDVLIVCTSRLSQPIFQFDWLHAGQSVLNVHAGAWPGEITEQIDRVSCDDRAQVLDPTNGLVGSYPALDPDFELGAVVAGEHPGRESPDHIIFSFNYGLALFDLLVADRILAVI